LTKTAYSQFSTVAAINWLWEVYLYDFTVALL